LAREVFPYFTGLLHRATSPGYFTGQLSQFLLFRELLSQFLL
jgi:hypothetical protein